MESRPGGGGPEGGVADLDWSPAGFPGPQHNRRPSGVRQPWLGPRTKPRAENGVNNSVLTGVPAWRRVSHTARALEVRLLLPHIFLQRTEAEAHNSVSAEGPVRLSGGRGGPSRYHMVANERATLALAHPQSLEPGVCLWGEDKGPHMVSAALPLPP